MTPTAQARRFLFLQGPLSPLYARMADLLERQGHEAMRINLCVGDAMHWRRRGAVTYRGRVSDWPAFIDEFLDHHAVTDLILHGDRRVYHRIASGIARRRGIRVIATELGYLRPDWMTIERDATASGSHFPRDPDEIRRLAEASPEIDFSPQFRGDFLKVAVPDVLYNLSNTLFWFLYPHYQRHTIYFPPLEYSAWVVRLATKRARERRALRDIDTLIGGRQPYFVVPLQLEGDFQIREHSPFGGIAEALDLIFGSFALHAPGPAHLVVKTHPLDNGLERWPRVIDRLSDRYGLGSRIVFLDGGSLDRLVTQAAGMVTINSSAGIEALRAGCPVKVLAPAIYDLPGLTHQSTLDDFWAAPCSPDAPLVEKYVKALAATVQVRGTIYSDEGLAAAASNMVQRILQDALNAPLAAVLSPAPSAPTE